MYFSKKIKSIILFFCAGLLSQVSIANQTEMKYGVVGANLVYRAPTSKMLSSNSYKVRGVKYNTLPYNKITNYTQTGVASFYGGKFNGRRTANGEIFSEKLFTAAHKTLPMNTYLLVTNLRNKRKVVVRVNDRGPFIGNRIIDLSRAAARELRMLSQGVQRVKLEVIKVNKNGSLSGLGGKQLIELAKVNKKRNASSFVYEESKDEIITDVVAAPTKIVARAAKFEQISGQKTLIKVPYLTSEKEAKSLIEKLQLDKNESRIAKSGEQYELYIGPFEDKNRVNQIKLSVSRLGKTTRLMYNYKQ